MDDQDITDRRLRCYGHVLNLVGRAFLYGNDSESLEQESQRCQWLNDDEADLKLWRRHGPVGKLHNFVKWVRSSPQRSEYFRTVVQEVFEEGNNFLLCEESNFELQLVLNNETRWNSTYLMIERALKKQGEIQAFLAKNKSELDPQRRVPEEDLLTYEDWRLLIELKEILEPLYQQTLRTQGWSKNGSHGCIWEVLTGMEYLLSKMENWKTFFDETDAAEISVAQSYSQSRRRQQAQRIRPRSPHTTAIPEHTRAEYLYLQQRLDDLPNDSRHYFRVSVNNGWKKLNEYYTKLGATPLYSAAVILHPALGFRWLETQWATSEQLPWLHEAKEGLRQYWQRWYQAADPPTAFPAAPPSALSIVPRNAAFQQSQSTQSTDPSEFNTWLFSQRPQLESLDLEIDQYLHLDLSHFEKDQDPIQWWIARQDTFPTLSRLAFDIFAIPAMSADCERAFSLSKLTLTSQRLAMTSNTLEQIQCLKNWYRRNAISIGEVFYNTKS
jgi:hypothetical protein